MSVPARHPGPPAELTRLIRFCEVGATNTVITLATYSVLVAASFPAWVASALAFAAGAVNGYHWNSRWTFADRARGGSAAAATRLRYVVVQGIGTAASALGVLAAHGLLGLSHLPAELVIIPLVTVMTYGLMRGLVFAPDASPDRAASA